MKKATNFYNSNQIKDTTFYTNNMQNTSKSLSKIGLYNLRVKNYLDNNPQSDIAKYAVKNFQDNAKRKRFSNDRYNEAVELFNAKHGLLLLKKGNQYLDTPKYYAYINFPYLSSKSIKKTMDNYRAFREHYNGKAKEINKEIKQYNSEVVISELSDDQKRRKLDFQKKNSTLFVWEYNRLAEIENNKQPIIPKKKVQTIKLGAELIFHVLVGFYASQLRDRNEYLSSLGKSTSVLKTGMPKLRLDQRKLAKHKSNGISRLGICKKTAQNHIKRLLEAGVLVHYTFINRQKPIHFNINHKILVILDGNLPKSQTPENKGLLESFEKELPDNRERYIYNSINKKYKSKECAKSTSLNKSGSMLEQHLPVADVLQTATRHTNEDNKQNSPGAAKIQNIIPEFIAKEKKKALKKVPEGRHKVLSENFLNNIMDERELAKQLAQGKFEKYRPLPFNYLKKVEMYGHVSLEEFRTVLIQDFIKTSAKIWKNHTVEVGSWKNAITMLNAQLFARIQNKDVLIIRLQQYRWRLDWARKWFLANKEVNALYPSLYFDKHRTQSFEIGFSGTRKFWMKNVKKKKELEMKDRQRLHKGNSRKRSKFNEAIFKYRRGEYTHVQLYRYVQDNLPHQYLKSLKSLLKTNKTL